MEVGTIGGIVIVRSYGGEPATDRIGLAWPPRRMATRLGPATMASVVRSTPYLLRATANPARPWNQPA